jgi:hypothetical protein
MKINWKEIIPATIFLLVGILLTVLSIFGIITEKNPSDIAFIGSMGILSLICGILWFIFTYDFFIVYYEAPNEDFKKVLFKNKYLLVNITTNMAYELPMEFFNKNLKYIRIKFCYDIRKRFRKEEFYLHDQVFID